MNSLLSHSKCITNCQRMYKYPSWFYLIFPSVSILVNELKKQIFERFQRLHHGRGCESLGPCPARASPVPAQACTSARYDKIVMLMVKKACQYWEWYRLIDNKKSVSQKLNEKTRSKWDFDEDKTCQSVLIMSDIPLSLKGSLKLTSLCLGPFSKLKTHDDPERWMCVYPAYLNKNKSLQERMGAKLLVCLLSMVFDVPSLPIFSCAEASL